MTARWPGTVLRAVRGVAHRVWREIGGIRGYWSQERPAIRRGLGALLLATCTGIVAGAVLADAEETLEAVPGLLLIVPAAIDMRGNIYGALASRLSTAIHTGEFERDLRRQGFLRPQIEATSYLTVGTSVVIAAIGWMFAAALGLTVIPLLHLVVIATVGGVLSSVLLLALTIVLSRLAHARDWNLDDVGAPTITVAGDVLTIPALLIATRLLSDGALPTVLGLILTLLGLVALVVGWMHRGRQVRRIVRESAPTLTASVAVGILAGTILESRVEDFLAAPWLLVLIPPFVATSGSLGGMLSSRFASKLHLGLLAPRTIPGRVALHDASLMLLFGMCAFTSLGALTLLWSKFADMTAPGVAAMFGLVLLAGLVSVLLLTAVAYTTAIVAHRFKLDPDNQGVPIVTSAMDLGGLLILVGIASQFGMG